MNTLNIKLAVLLPLFCSLTLLFHGVRAQQKTDTAGSMVATAHPLATKAGMEVLSLGGNAFDAITAAAFMLAVVEPTMSGIGGRLQVIYQTSAGIAGGIDATTQVPISYAASPKEAENGCRTIGVPGMVKGILALHANYGILPLKAVMGPAIRTAKDGFIISADESARMASAIAELKKHAYTSEFFIRKDTIPLPGILFRQDRLAKTLNKISSDQGKSFYTGPLAKSLAKQVLSEGGFLTFNDMKQYEALPANLLKGSYRGYDIIALGMPSYGAIVIEMLHMLEQEDLSGCSESNFLLLHAKAHKKAYEDRRLLKPQELLLVDKQFAERRWKDSAKNAFRSPDDGVNGHTTHLVASDQQGNIVSLTQSLGPVMGSKVASRDGYMLATTMGPYLNGMKSGERASSHIAPVIILKDGKPVMALGAAGGARIVPAVVQVISRCIDQQLPIEKALAAARVYQLGDRIQLENHPNVYWRDPQTLQVLKSTNPSVTDIRQIAQFARVHAVYRLPGGGWVGAADPDWSGTAGD